MKVRYHIQLNSSVFWAITKNWLAKNRRFGTTYRSHLQGSNMSKKKEAWPLKMGPTGNPETSVLNQHTLRNNAEDINHLRTVTHETFSACIPLNSQVPQYQYNWLAREVTDTDTPNSQNEWSVRFRRSFLIQFAACKTVNVNLFYVLRIP